MKKMLIILVLLLITIGVIVSTDILHKQNLTNERSKQKLVMGTSLDYPPFEFLSFGNPQGYDVDLAYLIAEELNFEIELKDMDFNSLIASLNTHKVDFVIAAMAPSPTRAKNVDFTRPYYNSKVELVTLENANHQKDVSKFNNKKIGAQMGTTMESYLKKKQKLNYNLQVVSLVKIPELVEQLKIGHLDGILLDAEVAHKIISKNTGFKSEPVNDFEGGYSVVLPFNSQLTEQFNNAINKLEKEGKLKQLEEKWITLPSYDH